MALRRLTVNILLFGVAGTFLWGQGDRDRPLSDLEYRYQKMEERALNLSQRLSAISGSDPIELIDRDQSFEPVATESAAQYTFDSLPGPVDKVDPLPTYEEKNMSASPAVYHSEVSRVVPTTQQNKGNYYFMPFAGFAFTSSIKYSFIKGDTFSDTLDGKWGNSVGLSMGKRWDNWEALLRVSYQYQKLEKDNFKSDKPTTTIYNATVTEESFLLSLAGGYSIPLTNHLSTYGKVGIGLGYRQDLFNASATYANPLLGIDPNFHSDDQSSLVFTYDFSMGFEYLFNSTYSVLLGYRLLGLTSNDAFEGSFQHLIELGVGANF